MKKLLSIVLLITAVLSFALSAPALADPASGAKIFSANCAQCHAGGRNLIQADKALTKAALEKNGMYSADAIVAQVTKGKNAMPSFKGRLDDVQIADVASYSIFHVNVVHSAQYIQLGMKPYSIDFREKVIKAYEQGDTSIRKVAARFDVSKAFVQKLLKQKQTTGDLRPGKQGGSLKSVLNSRTTQLAQMVEKYPASTLSEYCEYWQENHQQWVSRSMMCRELKKQHLTRKKRRYAVVSAPQNECKSSGVSIGKR